MQSSLLDRWTDTAIFRLLLVLAGLVAVPILLLGLVVTAGLLFFAVLEQRADLDGTIIVLLSLGGALGLLGYGRAVRGARNPRRHNVTATLLLLASGVATALYVAGVIGCALIESWRTPWGAGDELAIAAPLLTAHLVWVVAGVAWMQRLPRRYAEATGRRFDTVPVMLLFVARALATSAVLAHAAL